MEQALTQLRELGASGCVVLGEPGYYSRFGFNAEPSLVLPGVPAEYFQAISFVGSLPSGTVSYHDSFAARDYRFDSSKIESEFSLHATSYRQGIRESFDRAADGHG